MSIKCLKICLLVREGGGSMYAWMLKSSFHCGIQRSNLGQILKFFFVYSVCAVTIWVPTEAGEALDANKDALLEQNALLTASSSL